MDTSTECAQQRLKTQQQQYFYIPLIFWIIYLAFIVSIIYFEKSGTTGGFIGNISLFLIATLSTLLIDFNTKSFVSKQTFQTSLTLSFIFIYLYVVFQSTFDTPNNLVMLILFVLSLLFFFIAGISLFVYIKDITDCIPASPPAVSPAVSPAAPPAVPPALG
jgi:hypothetical protein